MIKIIFLLLFIWRTGLFLVSFLVSWFFSFTPTYPYAKELLASSGLPSWLWTWAGFDGVHYLTIARSGYSAQFTQAFFPLYPLIIKLVNNIFNNYVNSGLVVSNLFFITAIFLFYKLMKLDYQKNLHWIIIFLLIFPSSFFFGSLYSESLFLTLVLGSFLAARKEKWWLAGILGGLASATRLVGIFLLPALLWEWQNNSKFKVKSSKLIPNSQLLWLGLIPSGLLGYMIYLQKTFGDALYFFHAQPFFGASRSGGQIILLPQVIWRYIKILTSVPFYHYDFWIALTEFGSFFLVAGLLIIAYKQRVRMSYQIFSWLVFLTPTLTGTFSSLPRYVLPVFPIFIVLGNLVNGKLKFLLALLSMILLIVAASFFSRGLWVS